MLHGTDHLEQFLAGSDHIHLLEVRIDLSNILCNVFYFSMFLDFLSLEDMKFFKLTLH